MIGFFVIKKEETLFFLIKYVTIVICLGKRKNVYKGEIMNFFTNPDWFGRSGPFAYNLEYLVFIIIAIAFSVVFPIILRKKQSKTVKSVLITLWCIAVALDGLKYGYGLISNIASGNVSIANIDLPLWTCSMYLYLMPFALFCKNEKVARACSAFICTISFFGGIINFAVPAEESFFSFYGLHKFIYHYVLMLTPIVMLSTGYIKLKIKDVIGIMAIFVIFGIPVYIFNAITHQDYMFTYDGSWLPIDVSFISFKPLYTLICLVMYCLVTLLFIGIDIGIRKLACIKSKKCNKTE